jgi:hypothetical protein
MIVRKSTASKFEPGKQCNMPLYNFGCKCSLAYGRLGAYLKEMGANYDAIFYMTQRGENGGQIPSVKRTASLNAICVQRMGKRPSAVVRAISLPFLSMASIVQT